MKFWSYLHRWIYGIGDQRCLDIAHDGVDQNIYGMDHVSYPCGTLILKHVISALQAIY